MSGREGDGPDPQPKQIPERKRYGKGTDRVNKAEELPKSPPRCQNFAIWVASRSYGYHY
jgi:hypothetical protein